MKDPKEKSAPEPVPVATPNPAAENIIRESERDADFRTIEMERP